ncbi:MAG: tetratricopeptide repeat protein, partial [Saprospiraceae bacterium]|nr:tetratricopeptide repeat protein [Saprospiraceae bacterium]
QIPMIVGNKGAQVAQVDPPTLAALKQERAKPAELQLTAIASRSVTTAPVDNDTSTAALIAKFEIALQNGRLIENGDGAYEYYQQVKSRPDAQPYTGLMRLNLAAKLQDEAQIAINDYLSGKQDEMQKRWQFAFATAYDKYPGYLEKSAELLGADHFMYTRLKSREHYFAGLRLRLKYEQSKSNDPKSELLKMALAEQQKSIELDASAMFAYNEIGHLKILMQAYSEAVPQFEKAVSLSPTWALPWSNLAFAHYKMKQYDKAEQFGLKALKLDSTFFLTLYNLGLINYQKNEYAKAVNYYKKALLINPEFTLLYFELGLAAFYVEDYQTSEIMTLEYVNRAPNNPIGYQMLGEIALKNNKRTEAEAHYKRAIELNNGYSLAFYSLGDIAFEKNDLENAKTYFTRYLVLEKNDFDGYWKLACVYVKLNDNNQAVTVLQNAFDAGVGDTKKLENEACFEPLMNFPAYQQLLTKYRKKE